MEYDESLMDAARRELLEETGISLDYLEQFKAYGNPNRDPRGRAVSVVFYNLIHTDSEIPRAGSDAARVQWFPLEQLPDLAFDHGIIMSEFGANLKRELELDPGRFIKMRLSPGELGSLKKSLGKKDTT